MDSQIKLDRNMWVDKIAKNRPIHCQEHMLFFCLPMNSQPRLNLLSTQRQGRAQGDAAAPGARTPVGKQKNRIFFWQRTSIVFEIFSKSPGAFSPKN